jgi:hypothetical protein
MVYNKRVRSLRGRIKGVEGWEGGELAAKLKDKGRPSPLPKEYSDLLPSL